MEHLFAPLMMLLAYGWWPYWGGMSMICAIIGFFIAGALGLVLGLFFGPIGLLIALLVPRRTVV